MLLKNSKRFGFIFLLMLAFVSLYLSGFDQKPKKNVETPASKQLAAFIETLNSGKRAIFRSFIKENYQDKFLAMVPLEEHVNVFSEIYDQSRGYDPGPILKASDTELNGLVRNRLSDQWSELILRVEAAAPYKITGLGIRPASTPSDLPAPQALSSEEAAGELEKFFDKLVEADVFSGSVLVAKDGQPFFKKAYGQASKDCGLANRVDTKFNLGSMNKMFTAVAIGQLIEKGKLHLDDAVSSFLGPDWLKPEFAKKVQIRHLLSHTSGLGSYFNEKFVKSSRLLFRKVDDYKPLLADEKLAFEPGTRWQYSNTGFLLLGAVIEKVTGQTYFDYVRENIYKPAGMINTDSYEMDQVVPNLAIGYAKVFKDDGGYNFRNNLFDHVVKGGPAGGGFSTAEDLMNFSAALRSYKLLTRELTELLMSPKPEINSPNYGYGFSIETDKKLGRIAGHSGGFTGISSDLDMYLDKGYTVVVMSNYGGASNDPVQKIRELLSRIK